MSTKRSLVHLEAKRTADAVKESLRSTLYGEKTTDASILALKAETFSRESTRTRELSVEAMANLLYDVFLEGKPQYMVEEPALCLLKKVRSWYAAESVVSGVTLDDAILEGEKAEGAMEIAEQEFHRNPNAFTRKNLERANRRRTMTGNQTVMSARTLLPAS